MDARKRADARRRVRRQRVLAAVAVILTAAAGAAIALRLREHARYPLAGAQPALTIPASSQPGASPATVGPAPAAGLIVRENRIVSRLAASGLPVLCGGHHGRLVALTFDDGPGPYTPLAVRILRSAHARATFFLVGRNIGPFSTYAHSELQLAVLGDHTWTHPNLVALSSRQITSELASTQHALEHVTRGPINLFRPPYGQRDSRVQATARGLGMLDVLWSVDSRDSAGANWKGIAANVAGAIRPGSIVLMHENRGQTIRALRYLILPMLARRHLTAVSVPELLARDPPTQAQIRSGLSACLRG